MIRFHIFFYTWFVYTTSQKFGHNFFFFNQLFTLQTDNKDNKYLIKIYVIMQQR